MSSSSAKQLRDGFGKLLTNQYYDSASDTYKPGSDPGTGGGGGSSTMPASTFAAGTLAGTQVVQSMAGAPIPATVELVSSAGTRAIEYSVNGSSGPWRAVTYDVDDASGLVLYVNMSITHVRLTGVVGNTWSIR